MVAPNKAKTGKTAIKFFKYEEAYWREELVYERLEARGYCSSMDSTSHNF